MAANRQPVALADIAEDELLFVVPSRLHVTVENSDLSSKDPELLSNLDPWLVTPPPPT